MARHSAQEFDPREVLRALSEAPGGRLSFHDLADRCAIPRKQRTTFRRFLRGMVLEGLLRPAKGRGFRLGSRPHKEPEWSVQGRVKRHRDGFGFLIREDGEDDLFLPRREMRELFDGDVVRAVPVPGRYGRLAGRVASMVERGRVTVSGTYRRVGAGELVFPDPEIYDEPIELLPGAVEPRDGEIVEVEIRDFPEGSSPAVGRIVEILGAQGELGTLLELVIRRHRLRRRFPDDALEEAEALPEAPSAEELAGRVDLREVPTFTIDGEDARDFDDAVSVARRDGGFLLQVSIADVAHYVREDSPLDREALERGTSVYFPDRVIPMLPERLSNGIASLKPAEERLTLSVEIEFDEHGQRVRARLFESAIRSWGRWTYENVARVLGGEEVPGISEHRAHVDVMHELMRKLRSLRQERGSLDFDLPEPDVILDASGHPEDVVRSERTDAHRIIEELMIAANEAVADWLEAADHLPRPRAARIGEGARS